jgi:maltose O-acetyltransferase
MPRLAAMASLGLRRAVGYGTTYLRGQRSLAWYEAHGLSIGQRCELESPFELDRSHCWLISIGDDVTFAPNVYVLAHDASTKPATGHTRIAPVRIGRRVFVGARTMILPGVTIGDDVIIGAASVVVADIPSGTVAAGHPARAIQSTESYYEKLRAQFQDAPRFGPEWTVWGGISAEMKAQMAAQLTADGGFVV